MRLFGRKIILSTALVLTVTMGLRANFCLLGFCGEPHVVHEVERTAGCHDMAHESAESSDPDSDSSDRSLECCEDLIAQSSNWLSGVLAAEGHHFATPIAHLERPLASAFEVAVRIDHDLPPPNGDGPPLYLRHQTFLN